MTNLSSAVNKYHNKFIIVVIIIVVLMVIFLAYRFSQTAVSNVNLDELSNLHEPPFLGNVIALEDPNTVKVGSKTIVMPEGWIMTTAYQNTDDSRFQCDSVNPSDCRVYSLTNGSYNFYLTSPVTIKANVGPKITIDRKSIDFAGTSTGFIYEKLTLETRDDLDASGTSTKVSDEKMYYQIYGCLDSSICLNTLSLDLNKDINQNQVLSFEELAKEIKVI